MKRLHCAVISSGLLLSACGGGGGGGGSDELGFTPTNVATASFAGILGTVTIDGCGAQIRGTAGNIGCDDPGSDAPNGGYLFQEIAQSDGSKIAVFIAASFIVPPGVEAQLINTNIPVALVALDSIEIDGSITVEPGTGGGGTVNGTTPSRGSGVGGGLPATMGTSDGGGSYCGMGGGGEGGIPGMGGPTYGDPTLSPLMPGSSGGGTFVGEAGGAIQLVAGDTVRIGAAGFVTVPGGGGDGGGGGAGGGGSGGAILIEASNILIAGRVTANGGGGAAGTGPEDGKTGSTDDIPAPGGVGDPIQGGDGGAGGAGATVDGAPGKANLDYPNGTFAGNGGGGAGRIRLNSRTGVATVSGIVSPSLTSACATQATLAP